MSKKDEMRYTGKFWLERGSLSGLVDGKRVNIRQGDEIPEGLLNPERMEKLESEKKIGEKIVSTQSVAEQIRVLRQEKAALEKELEKAKKSSGGSDSDKVKNLKEALDVSESANQENINAKESAEAETEALKDAIAKLSEEYPELETKIQEILEADVEDESLLGKLGSFFSRDR